MADAKLTPKQAKFVQEYLRDRNGTQAAIRCGYSKKTARQQGARLLSKAAVREAVNTRVEKDAARFELDRDEMLRELRRIATADLSQAFDESGSLKKLHEIPEDVRRAIAGLEHNEFGPKLKLWDKNAALKMALTHLGELTEKVEHSGKVTFEQILAESYGDGGEE